MRYLVNLLLCMGCIVFAAEAQLRVGVPGGGVDGSASLDIKPGPYSSGSPYRGLLLPKMTTSQRNQIQAPSTGLMLYNIELNRVEVNNGTTSAPVWGLVTSGGSAWSTTGNNGTVDGANFIGTGDDAPVNFRVFNQTAGRIDHKLFNLGMGFFSINPSTTGTYNTAVGSYTLRYNTSGIANTAVGAGALTANTSGTANTGVGHDALIGNSSGTENTGVGQNALRANTTGFSNSAFGADALYSSIDGYDNTALGGSALFYNTNGYYNTATGALALRYNTTGYSNTAVGNYALQNNISGYLNSSLGFNAGPSNGNSSVHHSVAIGSAAVSNALYSIAIGSDVTVNTSGGGLSTAIGALSSIGANITNATVIGARGVANTNNTVVLGDVNVTSLRCNVQTISSLSDKRIKEDVRQNVPGLKFISRLIPVTYRINKTKEAQLIGTQKEYIQEDNTVHSGFLAQDVEAVAKEVGYNFEGVRKEEGGKYYTLGYTLFVVPLVQAVKDLNKEVEELKYKLNEKENEYKMLSTQVEEIRYVMGLSKKGKSRVSKK